MLVEDDEDFDGRLPGSKGRLLSAQQQVRIGFVGCGGNGQGHLHSLVAHADASVVAVCDVNSAAAEKAAGLTGGKPYQDYREMLDKESLDAVYLSLPPFSHGEMELAVIEHGLPFFVEKPVALDLGVAGKIAEGVRKKNLITCVGYQLRYAGTAELARETLRSGQVGVVSGVYWCGTGRVMAGRWWLQRDRSGGQLVEQATHTVDMMRYLAGEIAEVFCWENLLALDSSTTDCPDVTALAIRFESGAVGALTCTSSINADDWSYANIIDLTSGERRLRWTYGSLTITNGGDTREEKAPSGSIDDAFVRAVKNNDRSLIRCDYDDAVRTLVVTLAAAQSARERRPVSCQVKAPQG